MGGEVAGRVFGQLVLRRVVAEQIEQHVDDAHLRHSLGS
jgi:hypothetical protein